MPKPPLTLLFRDKRQTNHSIERLFAALEPHFAEAFEVRKVVVPRQPSGLLALIANIRHARREARGLIHITGDAQYLVTFLPRGRTVLTIHDCGYLLKLTGLKKWLYRILWFVLPCRAAARVTVISNSTKQVLESQLGTLGDKLRVVENCVTRIAEYSPRTFNAERPKILQIGSGRHKNLDTLIKAVDGLDCEIKVVGKLADDNRAEMERRGIRYTSEHGVSDSRLKEIYQECDLLFFASRHEGFGLPILEAQGIGMPVVTSDCYSMPDVAGGAAAIVEPESASQIREALQRIINKADYREELIVKGLENVKRYHPKQVAANYIAIYKQLINQ